MPEIAAFRGWRYNPQRYAASLSRLIAPPYDVLDARDKADLLAGHPCNIVAVDLPHVPPKTAGPDEVYAQAAATLKTWMADGTLVRDERPALYVYHQEYVHGGRRYLRRKFFARMRLEPFGTGSVFPHEQTFGGPKEDRLKLMKATRCQLSAVFGLYSDPQNRLGELLLCAAQPADMTAEQDGVVHRLWVIQDPAMIQEVVEVMGTRPVYIADGHHRYGTALMYREQLQAQAKLPADHPAHFVLIGLCAMEDPGAVILPTHRIVSLMTGGLPVPAVLESLSAGVDLRLETVPPADPELLLPTDADDDLVLYVAATDSLYRGRFRDRAKLRTLEPRKSKAWCELDIAYVQRYLIGNLIIQKALSGREPTIHYSKSAREAMEIARQSRGLALLCKPCTMAQLKAVSDAGDLMPQKSTYFYPKLATGLVIYSLQD